MRAREVVGQAREVVGRAREAVARRPRRPRRRQEKSPAPPPGYAYGPPYRTSLVNRLRAILFIALGRPRSLARDALLALRDAPHPPLVREEDRLPESGPLVIIANHYERPGLWMAWAASIVSDLVLLRLGQDTRWIAIQEWESFSLWGIPIPPRVTRLVFKRAFHTYHILAMPPAQAKTPAARASSMRIAMRTIKEGGIIGLMPEGTIGRTPELLPAQEGSGGFLLLLAAAGARIVPVGLYEENDRLVTQIGEPYTLEPPLDIARDARDAWARDTVMRSIKALLPEPLWGVYRD